MPKNIARVSDFVELHETNGPHNTLHIVPLWSRITHPYPAGPGFLLDTPSKFSFKVPFGGGFHQGANGIWIGEDEQEMAVTQSFRKSNKDKFLNYEAARSQLPTSLIMPQSPKHNFWICQEKFCCFSPTKYLIKSHVRDILQIVYSLH